MKKLLSAIVAFSAFSAFAQVNINTANVDELSALSGIGESKAKAIIEHREANGNFTSPESLSDVKGIGDKTLEKIIDDIVITGETDLSKIN